MPDRSPCPQCAVLGFVRYETVIKGTSAYKQCYCGHCNYSWEIRADSRIVNERADAADRPERSRSR